MIGVSGSGSHRPLSRELVLERSVELGWEVPFSICVFMGEKQFWDFQVHD